MVTTVSESGGPVAESTDSKPPKSTWDRIALPLLIGIAAPLIVAAVVAVVSSLTRGPKPVQVNIELIVDVSDEMGKRFGGSTRFKAAIAELLDFVEPRDADNLALWTSGGSCGAEGTEEVVPLGQQNSDEIQAALRELEPRGPANLGDAIVEATGTFSDPERFPAGVQKNVILLTAGRDTCDEDYLGAIEDRLEEVGEEVGLKFHFFTLNVPERLKEQLRMLQRRLPGQVEIDFAETPADLGRDIDVLDRSLPPGSTSETETPTAGPFSPSPAG
jgi:hypothetical protein